LCRGLSQEAAGYDQLLDLLGASKMSMILRHIDHDLPISLGTAR
jgi:hypothetical protein